MSKAVIYLDYMASTPCDPRVIEAMQSCLGVDGDFANPSSTGHRLGLDAAARVADARDQVASALHCLPSEIIFTSGATEANNLAILGAAQFYQRKGRHIITLVTEHNAVLLPCEQLARQGFDVTYLKVEKTGLLDLNVLRSATREDTILISIMFVNNEIGVIQDLASIATLAREKGILFHSDATQAVGKIPIDLHTLPIDLMSFSAHKVYGPKGIGALFVRQKPRVRLQPLLFGGGQEQGLRPGTLATHQIVGMGEAFNIAKNECLAEQNRIRILRDRIWQDLQTLGDIELNGHEEKRIVHNLNFTVEFISGEALLAQLDNLALSSGSACNTTSIEASHVVRALGHADEYASNSVRLSLGRFTTDEEVDEVIKCLRQAIISLRAISPLTTDCVSTDHAYVGRLNKEADNVYYSRVGEERCGDIIDLYFKVVHKKIIDIRFQAYGSLQTIRACEYVCEHLAGQAVSAVIKLDFHELVKALNLSKAKQYIAVLLIDACQRALEKELDNER